MHPKEKYYHQVLAEYFMAQPLFFDEENKEQPNEHKCMEQPFQLLEVEAWQAIIQTLTNLWFIEAKIRCGEIDDLCRDFDKLIDDTSINQQFTNDMLLLQFSNFVNNSYLHLKKFGHYKFDSIVQASNYSKQDKISVAANNILSQIQRYVYLDDITKPDLSPPHPFFLRQIDAGITSQNIDATPDLGIIVGASKRTLKFYSYMSFRPFKEVNLPIEVDHVYFVNNYTTLILSGEKKIIIYSVSESAILKTIEIDNLSDDFAVSADGRFIIYGLKFINIYDLRDQRLVHSYDTMPEKYPGHAWRGLQGSLYLTPDGETIVSSVHKTNTTKSRGCCFLEISIKSFKNIPKCHQSTCLTYNMKSIICSIEQYHEDGYSNDLVVVDISIGEIITTILTKFDMVGSILSRDRKLAFIISFNGEMISVENNTFQIIAKYYIGTSPFDTWLNIDAACKKAVLKSNHNISFLDLSGKNTSPQLCDGPVADIKGISENGKLMGTKENDVCIYDLKRGSLFIAPEANKILGPGRFADHIFFNDGTYLLRFYRGDLSYSDGKLSKKTNIKIWDTIKNKLIKSYEFEDGGFWSYTVLKSPTSNIAILPNYQSFQIYDLENDFVLNTLSALEKWPQCYSDDGRLLFCTYKNGIDIVDTANPKNHRSIGLKWDNSNKMHFQYHKVLLSPCNTILLCSERADDITTSNYDKNKSRKYSILDIQTGISLYENIDHECYTPTGITSDGRYVLHCCYRQAKIISLKDPNTFAAISTVSWLLTSDSRKLIYIKNNQTLVVYSVHKKYDTLEINIVPFIQQIYRVKDIVHELHSVSINSLYVSVYSYKINETSGNKIVTIWNLETGQLAGHNAEIEYFVSNKNQHIFKTKKKLFRFSDSYNHCGSDCKSPPFITGKRLWYQEVRKQYWDKTIAYICPHCTLKAIMPKLVHKTIKSIHKICRVYENDSPVLKLPDEAWDDPKLLFDCPKCGGKLKSNPFVVDNRGRYE